MKTQSLKLKAKSQNSKFKTFTLWPVVLLWLARGFALLCGVIFAFCALGFINLAIATNLKSESYQIDMGHVNMGAGSPSSSSYNLGITMGQIAPGTYENTGYIVRAGFQYIHTLIPFTFSLSPMSLDFGSLVPDVLTNEQKLTLTVNSGSAGGYQVTVQENDPLTAESGSTIPDTTCDPTDTCTHIDSGTWTLTSTYGFGYNMTGTDVPSEFSGNKYKNFPDTPGDSPQKIMGKTPAEGHQAGRNKTATMSARINISTTQEAGVYRNILTFIATPSF